MKLYTGLWIGKTGYKNAWYHIYPFAKSKNTKVLHIIRNEPPHKQVPKTVYHSFKYKNRISEVISYFLTGLFVLLRYKIGYKMVNKIVNILILIKK